MHGNVWEWCRLSGGKDPVGPTTPHPLDGSSGRNRVIRGGSWIDPPLGCTSANRFYDNPRIGNSVQGFRLAAVPSGE
jgi:formylglycine-generating enzyme required for sulfatase activity